MLKKKLSFIKFCFSSLFFIILSVLLSVSVFSAVFFSGFNYSNIISLNSDSQNFNLFSSYLINSEDKVFSELYLDYSIVRKGDNVIVYKGRINNLSFDNFEVKFINVSVVFNKPIQTGEYYLNVMLFEKSGNPISGVTKNIFINELRDGFREYRLPQLISGPYIVAYNNGSKVQQSFGTLGNNVPKNSSKFIEFSLSNFGIINLSLYKFNLSVYGTYSKDEFLFNISDFLSEKYLVNSSDSNLYFKIPLNFSIPGTYKLRLAVYDNLNELFEKEIRLVIAGKAASIVSVKNKKDVYSNEDLFQLSGLLIGPADGAHVLKNLSLFCKVIQNNTTVFTEIISVNELGFEPYNFEFKRKVPVSLNKYKVLLNLTDGIHTYDSLEINYEKLSPKFYYKNGLIIPKNFSGCVDDGVCTVNEKSFGNCLDCFKDKLFNDNVKNSVHPIYTKKNKNKSNSFAYLLFGISLLMFLMAGLGLWLLKRRFQK